ncbi:MAG: lipoyl(octanoyl) transferase [Persephonella sp.]|nr:MAG: lipoyl(octanoyl) transferase [Persephonella sp.]
MNKLKFIFLGLSDYQKFLDLQDRLTKGKGEGNYIIITEHYPVYTVGKRINKEDLPKKDLAPLIKLNRGGGITFHGFNQIVVYPILDLRDYKLNLKKYIRLLEDIMINSLKEIGINAYRKDGLVGVFTNKGKIGFVGINISQFITNFGFSINYEVDKNYFYNINPCGLKDEKIANITDFLDISKSEFINILYKNLKKIF